MFEELDLSPGEKLLLEYLSDITIEKWTDFARIKTTKHILNISYELECEEIEKMNIKLEKEFFCNLPFSSLARSEYFRPLTCVTNDMCNFKCHFGLSMNNLSEKLFSGYVRCDKQDVYNKIGITEVVLKDILKRLTHRGYLIRAGIRSNAYYVTLCCGFKKSLNETKLRFYGVDWDQFLGEIVKIEYFDKIIEYVGQRYCINTIFENTVVEVIKSIPKENI